MKKNIKVFAFAILAFFMVSVPVLARELTLTELGKEIDNRAPGAYSAYIIGNYVFTSNHKLTTQDLMLASRTIKLTDADGLIDTTPSYQKMSIQRITKKYDENADPTGWEVDINSLGSTALKLDENNKIDIKYIDYDFVKIPTEASIGKDFSGEHAETYKQLIETTYGFAGGNVQNTEGLTLSQTETNKYKLIGLLKKFESLNSDVFSGEDLTGYYFSFYAEFNDKNLVNDSSVITIKALTKDGEAKDTGTVFKRGSFDSESGIVVLYAYKPASEYQVIEVTLDYDGEGDTYTPIVYTIDLSELRVPSLSNAEFSGVIPQTDLEVFKSWNYAKPDTVIYNPTDNGLKLTGYLASQEINNDLAKFSEEDNTGYYVLVNINSSDFIPGKTTIKMKKGKGTEKLIKDEIDKTGATVLIALSTETSNEDKVISVVVDLDGDESDEYLPREYEINWKELALEKSTKLTISNNFNDGKELDTVIKDNLKVENWFKESIKKVNVKQVKDKVTVTGVLPKINNLTGAGFTSEELTGYYLPLVISLEENPKEQTTITVPCRTCENGIKTYTGTTIFDNDNEILLFESLRELNDSFEIIVDLDGEANDYAPNKITVDYSGLTLQKETTIEDTDVEATIPEGSDKDYFINNYGYKFEEVPLTVEREGNTFKISGKVHEQEIEKNVFNEEEETNFYLPYNVNPTGVIKGKTTVTRPINQGKDNATSTISDDYGLSVLFSINPDKVKKCQEESESCQFKFTIDLDGNDDEYMPAEYTIDYSGIDLIKYIKATFELPKGDKKEVKLYSGESVKAEDITTPEYDKYHEFIKWTKNGEEFTVGETVLTEDATIKPNWEIKDKDYVQDKIDSINSDDYSVTLSEDNAINYELKKNDLETNVLSGILEPIIKEILSTSEIEKVTLTLLEGSPVEFSKQDESDIQSNLTTLLNGKTDLDELIDKNIQISITKKSDALVEFINTGSYNINFTAKYREAKSNEELDDVLNVIASNSNINTIIVTQNFDVKTQKNLSKSIEVKGNTEDITLTGNGLDSIFNVTAGEVVIKDLKLEGATSAIKVQNAATLTIDKVHFTTNDGAAIDVDGGSLIGTNLTYNGEKYDYPLVKAKNGSTINVTAGESSLKPTKKEKINEYVKEVPLTKNEIGETKVEDTDYNLQYTNYYLDSKVADRWIKMTFVSDRSVTSFPAKYILYFDKEKDYGNYAPEPDSNIEGFTHVSGKVIEHKLSGWKCTNPEHSFHKTGEITKPTEEVTYYADYTAVYTSGVKKVNTENGLQDAIREANGTTKDPTIIVLENDIALTSILDINNDNIVFTGVASNSKEINGGITGQIKVSANNITFEKINVTGSDELTSGNLVEVLGSNFRSDHVVYRAGEGKYTNMLNFNTENVPVETILYFNNFNLKNAKVGINFDNQVKGNTDSERDGITIIGNDFDDSNDEVTFIKMKNITPNTTLKISQSSIMVGNDGTYLLQLDASQEVENFYFTNIWFSKSTVSDENKKIKIKINTSEYQDASNMTFKIPTSYGNSKIKIDYTGEKSKEANIELV